MHNPATGEQLCTYVSAYHLSALFLILVSQGNLRDFSRCARLYPPSTYGIQRRILVPDLTYDPLQRSVQPGANTRRKDTGVCEDRKYADGEVYQGDECAAWEIARMAVRPQALSLSKLLTRRVHRDYYASLLRTHQAFVAPTQGRLLNYVQRVPLGVVAQITVSPAALAHGDPMLM